MKVFALLAAAVSLLCAPVARAQGVPVFVMMPLDLVSNEGVLNNPAQLESWFAQLLDAGVEGVMSDVWWGIVEQQPMEYNFTAYHQFVDLCAKYHLKFQAVMSFHRCGGNVGDACNVPLPSWVRDVGGEIYYKDAEGNQDQEYLSLFADELPLFGGRTPIQMYHDFMLAFAKAMDDRIKDGTIVQVEVSMGPAGEMRYPSYQLAHWTFCGVGEFQCYDGNALVALQKAATAAGHSDWGNGGPSNAGNYNSHPYDTGFFASGGYNNYQSDYGQFFLTWYSQQLLAHGDRVLSQASEVFAPLGVPLAGKVAGIHWWYKDESHAAELTAGYFNTDNHNAYMEIAAMFKKYNAALDFTCLEMQDDQQPPACDCGPFELVQQVKAAAHQSQIGFSGENALPRYDNTAYGTIEQQSTALGYLINEFTYLRLSDTLLEGQNWSNFKNFVSTMKGLSG